MQIRKQSQVINSNTDIKINEKRLEQVSSTKYLGITVDITLP